MSRLRGQVLQPYSHLECTKYWISSNKQITNHEPLHKFVYTNIWFGPKFGIVTYSNSSNNVCDVIWVIFKKQVTNLKSFDTMTDEFEYTSFEISWVQIIQD